LDELLRTISGFEVSESAEDLPLQPPSPSLVPKPITLLSRSIISPQSKSSSSQGLQIKEAADGCQQWLETLEHFLPHVLQHSAPMVSFIFLAVLLQIGSVVLPIQLQTGMFSLF
jgi:hypothetical protein